MSQKINIKRIFDDHFDTFRDRNGDILGWDVFSFVIFPAIMSTVLLYFKIFLSVDYVNIFVSALSIFVGLLFNVIVVMFDIAKKDKVRFGKLSLIRDVVVNISYSILVSVIAILTSLSTQIQLGCYYRYLSNYVNYFLLIQFLLTLLMILKRMYVVFVDEIDEVTDASQNPK